MPNASGDARINTRCEQASQTAPFTCERTKNDDRLVRLLNIPSPETCDRDRLPCRLHPHVDPSARGSWPLLYDMPVAVTPWLKLTEAVLLVEKEESNVMNFVRAVSPAPSPIENVSMSRHRMDHRRPSTMARNQLRMQLRAQLSPLEYLLP
jgi:hypothetical protein